MTTTAVAPETTDVATVPSYVQDAWWTPAPEAKTVPVRDASTGEVLANVSTDGLDLAAVVNYGRTTGQAELGKLTFHQRALKLKELAQYLNRPELKPDDKTAVEGAIKRLNADLQMQERLSRLVSLGGGAPDDLMSLFLSETLPLARPAAALS